uniref:Uncharacterized protein n=1 Tax=Utricularia reniformis TaxID=192314 RepID=A0A1Y0B0L5_9LAMI|nr:hypothetical protein AEK19_MT0731 [Utricularia reniformis]ART30975.1 hypothetical protein AEK19_MT0731 [Utricularia reniformis]
MPERLIPTNEAVVREWYHKSTSFQYKTKRNIAFMRELLMC